MSTKKQRKFTHWHTHTHTHTLFAITNCTDKSLNKSINLTKYITKKKPTIHTSRIQIAMIFFDIAIPNWSRRKYRTQDNHSVYLNTFGSRFFYTVDMWEVLSGSTNSVLMSFTQLTCEKTFQGRSTGVAFFRLSLEWKKKTEQWGQGDQGHEEHEICCGAG